jgi:hypothetical protein
VLQPLMNFTVKVNHGLGQPGFVDTWSPHQDEFYHNDIGMSKTHWALTARGINSAVLHGV